MNDDERCFATSDKIVLICNSNVITFGNGIKKEENKGKTSSLSTRSSSSRDK